jgi:hypothetical protein
MFFVSVELYILFHPFSAHPFSTTLSLPTRTSPAAPVSSTPIAAQHLLDNRHLPHRILLEALSGSQDAPASSIVSYP